MDEGRLVSVADTRLWVVERGAAGGFPLIVLHGGPGLDHHMFADYLDPLTSGGRYRLVLVDERAQGRSDRTAAPGTWTLERMAADITDLAAALGLPSYGVLGHSFGAFLALQHAVDFPGAAAVTLVSSGVASARWLAGVEDELARFVPVGLREQVAASWAREAAAATREDVAALIADQMPFHFRDPADPRIAGYLARAGQMEYSPEVLRAFATSGYGGIEAEDRLADVPQPVLVLAGRYDRTCPAAAAVEMAARLPLAELATFEHSGHMTFVEETERYVSAVRDFLDRHVRASFLAERRAIGVRRFDELHSPHYDEHWGQVGTTHAVFVQRLAELAGQGAAVLDAACGTGKYWPMLLAAGLAVTGVDQSAGMLAQATRKHPGVSVRVLPLQDLAASTDLHGRFDGLLCVDALECVVPEDWPSAAAGLAAAMRPGAVAYVTVERHPGPLPGPSDPRQVPGELIEGGGYHYYPALEQVREWLDAAHLDVTDEKQDEDYWHFLLTRR